MNEITLTKENKIEVIKFLFKSLTDAERSEVVQGFCNLCWKDEEKHGKCYCSSCYDE